MSALPVTLADVRAARERIRPYLPATPLRRYATLEAEVGYGIRVFVKHDNHLPTQAFKARNGMSAMSALPDAQRRRGVVAATRGNHGQALAWAGQLLSIPVTICVPLGNNLEKNAAMRGFGAQLVEEGGDYDAAVQVADRLVRERGLTLIHSTNNADIIAGAGTMALEMLEQEPGLDALVLAVGGGSQAVGALAVAGALKPDLAVYAVQAAQASATHDSWHAKKRLTGASANTFADGLATRSTYDLTFPALQEGLRGFVTASEREIAEAVRVLLRTTHNLAEGAGAAGLAGLYHLRETLAGKSVGISLCGSNIDQETLRRVVARELERPTRGG
ncbi:MAG: threonine dehydratase [Myxococcales bacterium]